jgi:UDP-N-acetylmuramoyl-tripeptide--D-alanyl-D-alanine ligase
MSQPLWTLDDVLNATKGKASDDVGLEFSGLSIDSRTIAPGELYVAIKGDVHDGHDFVTAALDMGAGAALVAASQIKKRELDSRLIVVKDPFEAMRLLARAARRRFGGPVVAVTGSVGKTSTKEMLRTALSSFGLTHASLASHNNHWGVPLTLSRLPRRARFGVFEVGMNHSGEIVPLVDMIKPHVALITAVEAVHLENFPSVDAIADAKGEIFSHLRTGGFAIIPADNPYCERLRAHARASRAGRIITFGRSVHADVRVANLVTSYDSSLVAVSVFGKMVVFRLPVPGEHMAMNSAAVLAVGHVLGLSVSQMADALGSFRPVSGRGAQDSLALPTGGRFTLIDESYNANPASMRAALSILGSTMPMQSGRRLVVLGDMLELGEAGPQFHSDLASELVAARVDKVYAAGPLMRHMFEALPQELRGAHVEQAADLLATITDNLRAGDVLMAKGSNGSKVWVLINALKEYLAASQRAN